MNAVSASDSTATPLPEKLALLVHEARWLLVGLGGLYLALVLWGFDRADPGWSHSAAVERIANPGGRFGAWLGDLLLYLFGNDSNTVVASRLRGVRFSRCLGALA